MQRTKGQQGEREVAGIIRDLTGWDVQRRVRNHANDSDLTGVPGWSVEVERHKAATRAEIAGWWRQTCRPLPRMPARPMENQTFAFRFCSTGWTGISGAQCGRWLSG